MALSETTTPKELMLETIRELPEDSSYEEILRELAFVRMVERGLADSAAGRTISHDRDGPENRLMGKVRWTNEAESWLREIHSYMSLDQSSSLHI